MPPIIGAAMRFITSAPVPCDHMMGARPTNMVATVMNFGRMRFTAPCTMASRRSRGVPHQPGQPPLLVRQVQIEQHEDAGFRIHAHQRDQPHPDSDAHVVAQQ